MPKEVDKLKNLATNIELFSSEREKAIEALGAIGTKEAALALLDIAGNIRFFPSVRATALDQARKILKSL